MPQVKVIAAADEITRIEVMTSIFSVFLVGCVIYFVVLYRNRQVKNKKEQEEREAIFQQELLKTQVEIQEQTFEQISKEIHDNITQVLSFVKLTMRSLGNGLDEANKAKLNDSRELLSQTIIDLRDMSKSMSFEHIASAGLAKSIEKEVERMNKSDVIKVSYAISGKIYSLGEQRELVLFRILQESINNALKHSGAKHFNISLQYREDLFNLTLQDDGSGFTPASVENKSGSGLRNIENRAAMIGGKATIDSAPGKGCRVCVDLYPLKQFNTNGASHSNSFS